MSYNYEKKVASINSIIEKRLKDGENTLQRAMIIASLKRFYPELKEEQYDSFLRSVLINQELAWQEQSDVSILTYCTISDNFDHLHTPAIYCSFHLSSYRLSLLYLLTLKKPITLLASQKVIDSQKEIISKYSSLASGNSPVKLINANSPHSLLSMAKDLKDGRSLFVFIDGNTGAGIATEETRLTSVRILESEILARSGVAHLSLITNTPIVPIITFRNEGEYPSIKVFPKLLPSERYTDRSIEADLLTRKIYSIADHLLKKYPEQWEPWLYLYNFASKDHSKSNNVKVFKFNKNRYLFWNNKNKSYLIDNVDYSVIELDSNTMKELQKDVICIENIQDSMLRNLIANQIII